MRPASASKVMKRSVCAHLAAALLLVAVLFAPLKSRACGVNAHLWITDSAICQLPEGSLLRAFYTDQRHVDLTRLGSSFPDSGYAVSHAYGEVAHWPPFVQKYIEDFQSRFGVDDEAWSDEARAEPDGFLVDLADVHLIPHVEGCIEGCHL